MALFTVSSAHLHYSIISSRLKLVFDSFNARAVFNSNLWQIKTALQFLEGRKCLIVQQLDHTKSPC